MLPIPSWLAAHWPALLALVLSVAAGLLCRGKAREPILPAAAAIACLAGWAASVPLARLHEALLASGPGLLVAPAAAAALAAAATAWRGGRNRRLIAVAAAAFAGWWLARIAASGEVWRVWILTALLAWLLSKLLAQQALRGTALAFALWGGLLVLGAPPAWLAATAVLAAGWTGLLATGGIAAPRAKTGTAAPRAKAAAAPRATAALPSAVTAATIAWVALTRGRAFRFHMGPADWACLLALLAPLLAAWIERRWTKRLGPAAPATAAALGAALAVAALWLLRRTGAA